jgi:REP element-mobilizing transposase RayT
MARPLRIEYEGALYHVTSRGNERSSIFRDDCDRGRFLEILGEIALDSRWKLHAYCQMGNHYHLLVETPLGNLCRGMQRLNGRYTQWFNVRHRRAGHLLQGRYKAILVEKEPHLLELCRYVVLNPVRAGMVASSSQWPWSNYRATSGISSAPDWLEVDWTLSQFSPRPGKARPIYREFVSEGKGGRSPMREVRGQIYLGGERFRKEIDLRLKRESLPREIPGSQRRPWLADVGRIKEAVAREFGRAPTELSRRRGGNDKMIAIFLAREMTGLSGSAIGRQFGVSAAQVGNIVRSIRDGKRKSFGKSIERLQGQLESLP